MGDWGHLSRGGHMPPLSGQSATGVGIPSAANLADRGGVPPHGQSR